MGITKRISSSPAENTTIRVSSAPAEDITARVGENPTGEQTSRVGENPSGGQISRIHHLLLLEGDESGYLLLEGDAQTGTDKLELEGDATAIASTITKRVGTVA